MQDDDLFREGASLLSLVIELATNPKNYKATMETQSESGSQAFIKTLLGLGTSHNASDSEPEFIWGDEAMRDLIEHRRAPRADGRLLIDWQVEQLASDGYHALPYPPREPRDLLEYIRSTTAASSQEDWTIYYLLLDIAENTGQSDRPEKYAKREGFSQSLMNTIRGYWLLDHDRIEDGMSLLSSPSTVRSESDTFYEKILLTLSSIRTPEAVKWLHYYVDFTNAQLVKPFVRDAFVVALVERDFPRLWEWIRNWDFDTDLKYPHLVQGIDPEDEAENLEEMSQERERLLIVLLDLVFKPQTSRQPLEDLAIAPFDKFEEQILTAYLLDPATNLSPPAFDILHDLLTTRLLSHGRYSEAIDLDRRVTELVRSSQHEMANARLKRERRQMVDDMVGLLPRIQRDLLAAEKDLRDDMVIEESMLWASTPVESTSTPTGLATTQGVSVRMEARASKRVVSLSGLVSASPRRSEQPGGNLLHAILQNHAIAVRTQESNPAPPSPARRTGFEVTEHRSLKPIQQPRAQSPFSSPVKISTTFSSRAHAVSSLARPIAKMPGKAGSSRQQGARYSSEEMASGGESAGEKTPVAVRQRSPRRRVPSSHAEDVEMEQIEDTDPTDLSTEGNPVTGDVSEQAAADVEDTTPTKTQRKRQPRYETRRRQASVAASVETGDANPQVDPPESTKRPIRRSRAKQAPSMEPYVEILTSPPPRETRQKAVSVAPQDPGAAETDAVPAPKRPRRTAATPSQQNTPAPVKRTARQTRSQSVMSEATTEGGDEGAQARNLRRSGRLSSVTPVSPIKKAVAAEPGVRTRRATSRQPSEAPVIPETAKPRRQTTRK